MHACSSDHTLHVCRVGALTSVLSCRPLKKKIAHTATYFTVTSGRNGPKWNKEGRGGEGKGRVRGAKEKDAERKLWGGGM